MNDIDRFRQNFFDTVIEIEKKKEKEALHIQATCFHNYSIIGSTYSNKYQHRTCSKCGHATVKSMKVWNGTKGCIIA